MLYYAIPLPIGQCHTGEDLSAPILDRYQLGHLELRTIRDAALFEATIPSLGKVTVIEPKRHGQNASGALPPGIRWTIVDLGQHKVAIGHTDPPSPEMLQRSSMLIPGVDILDDAGRAWRIPIARSPSGRATIPTSMVRDHATGQVVRKRTPRAEQLWELSGRVWDAWNTGDEKIDDQFAFETAIAILQANYRISSLEIAAMAEAECPLLDDTRAAAIMLAFIDFSLIDDHAAAKKNDPLPATSNS